MALTLAQLQTLKTAILADQELAAVPAGSDGDAYIASVFNQAASPDFWVWRSKANSADLQGSAGFDWTRVDNMSVGQARIWEYMTRFTTVNPSLATVRAGINAAFSGTVAADVATRLSVFQACQRLATRGEKLFATGAGTTTSNAGVGPASLVVEGNISGADVGNAREM